MAQTACRGSFGLSGAQPFSPLGWMDCAQSICKSDSWRAQSSTQGGEAEPHPVMWDGGGRGVIWPWSIVLGRECGPALVWLVGEREAHGPVLIWLHVGRGRSVACCQLGYVEEGKGGMAWPTSSLVRLENLTAEEGWQYYLPLLPHCQISWSVASSAGQIPSMALWAGGWAPVA